MVSANIYESKQLKDVAIQQIQKNRETLKDEEFREKMKTVDKSYLILDPRPF